MATGKHDPLEPWQLAVGAAGVLVSVLVMVHKPKAAAASEPLPQTVGPGGFGEVGGGGGGGGGSSSSSSPAELPRSSSGGEQSPSSGNPPGPGGPYPQGKLVPKHIRPAGPGESQGEYEKRRMNEATPGARQNARVLA